ncbi:MAG: hypothetical protein AAFP90_14120 [Planctomycetota bacterium]
MSDLKIVPNEVPSYMLVVYLQQREDGRCEGRVMNLPDLVIDGDSERTVLGRLVPAARKLISEGGNPPGDPASVPSPLPGQQKRLIPIHI